MQIRVHHTPDRVVIYDGLSYQNSAIAECVAIVNMEGAMTPIFLARRNEECIDTLKRYLRDTESVYSTISYFERRIKP
jgi:hypothetical protein